jgi:hypothetical protein
MFDIVFLEYREPRAEEFYEHLVDITPSVKRVKDVSWIHNAHRTVGEIARTEMVWVVDGDCLVDPDFDFAFKPKEWDRKYTHVWYAQNLVNGSKYGYGGIKLFNRKQLIDNYTTDYVDYFATVSKEGLKVVKKVCGTTVFDQTEEMTRTAVYRELTKLLTAAERTTDTEKRIKQWSTKKPKTEFVSAYLEGVEMAYAAYDNKINPASVNQFTRDTI